MTMTPVIALVGRTNVGKSTLFNRLLEHRKAITSPIAGTTHDINFGHCKWRGMTFTVIDTAGLDLTTATSTEAKIKKQAESAIKKANVVFLLVDARAGLLPEDRAFAIHLRKSKGKKVFLVANKSDNPGTRRQAEGPEWLKLGLGPSFPVSAANGTGVGDLLDAAWTEVGGDKEVPEMPIPDVRAVIIGRPNVGKSSLLNAIAGEDRVIVSEVAHTTKEPQDTLISWEDFKAKKTKRILLVDTVGIRKKSAVEKGIEKVGVHMSLEELKSADVVMLMVDATEGVAMQEKRLAGFIEDHNVAVIIIVNKWDLAEERNLGTAEDYAAYIRLQFPSYPYAAVTFIAAKSGAKVGRLIPMILEVAEQRHRIVPQADLDKFVEKLKKQHHSLFAKGGDRFGKKGNRPKVYGITQTGTAPPAFMLVVADKESLHYNFLRFVENRLREAFGFEGTPIRVNAREIGDPEMVKARR
ncbi:MAG: hypothetical protein RLZZ324_801 [Candidatus Parcubacteria bacterium]